MKLKYTFILLIISNLAWAQSSNIFYDRAFWKTAPNIEVLEKKIKAGNDPVALNPYGFDAVVYATLENAPFATIKHLLGKKGNEVDKITHDGRNYLMWAAYKGNIELMKYLIEKDSQTDLIDDHGYNMMTFAAVAGQKDPKVYDLIIENGGSVEDTNREGANALLLLAPNLEDDQMIQYFQKKGLDIHSKDHEGNGLFTYAARMGNIEMMNKCIELGLDYKNLNKKGGNAVIFASRGFRAYTNPLEVYQYLEKQGLKMDVVNEDGITPLHSIAYRTKDYQIFEYFINKGLDINQADKEGNTVFLNAVRGGNAEIAKKLLTKVKDVNQANQEGYTALTYSIIRNSSDLFDVLISKGARTDIKDKVGNNLLYHVFKSFKTKEKASFEKYLQVLQSKGLDFGVQQAKGNTLLHLAVEKGEKYLIEKSLALGIDLNQKNENGLTALHLAAMKAKNRDILTLLIEKGANKAILTDFEESAYDLALENELLAQASVNLDFLKVN